MADLGQQTQLQASINDILTARTKLLADHEKSLSTQADIISSMKSGLVAGANKAADAVNRMAGATDKSANAADKAKESQQGFNVAMKQSAEEAEELEKKLAMASKVAGAFGDALSGATSGTFGLIKMAGSLVGTLFNVGQAILSLPFKLWDAFVEKSANMPYNPAFRQMKEDVTEMFGSLKGGAGGQVMGAFKELQQSSGAMAKETSLSMRKIFGFGVEGKAAMLGFIKDMSQGLGSQLGPIMAQIGSDIGRVTYAIKGMGLSNEETGSAMKFFYNSGQNASKMLQEMGTTAAMMAKQSGFNIKTLSKAMVETTQTFPQFAKSGVQAMAKVAHYTHNLGIEVKDLQGVFDKFDSFENAAEAASQLSQAFGVNIDAMKMVKEQDPTKRLEALRNAFKAAGKDINNMTSAERKLAESTTGLTGAAFEAAMGEGNKKKALSESEKAAQSATRAAKDQAKAMKELAAAIKKIVPPEGEKFQGFFDAFSKGFLEGMNRSENMRKMFINLQATFRQAYYFGRQLAQLLFDNFPAMDKLAKGFTELFNPAKFRKMFDEILGAFRTFFTAAQTDPKAGMQTLMKNIVKIFGDTFGGAGGALEKIKEGFKTIMSVLGVVFGELLKKLMELATEGIKNLVDLITGQATIDTSGATSIAGSFFGPIKDALIEKWPELKAALITLLEAAFDAIKPYLIKAATVLAKVWAGQFGIQLAAGLVKIAAGAAIQAGVQKLMNKTMPPPTPPTPPPSTLPDGKAVKQQGGLIKSLAKISFTDIGKATLKLVALAGMVTVGLGALIAGLALIFSVADPAQVAKWGLALIPMTVVIGILGGLTFLLSKQNAGSVLKATGIVALLGAILVGLAALSALVLPLFSNVKMGTVMAFVAVVIALVGAIALMALPVALIGALKLDPRAAAVAVAVIGVLGTILVALSLLVVGVLAGVAALITDETANKMIKISEAFATFADGLSSVGTAVLKFALAAFNPIGLLAGVASMVAIGKIMADQIPDMIEGVMDAMTGISADEVSKKIAAVKDLMQALDPMVNIAVGLSKMVSEMADEDIDAEGIKSVLTEMRKTFEGIMSSLSTFVSALITMSTGLSEPQIQSAGAVATLLGAAGTLISTMIEPLNKMYEDSKSWHSRASTEVEQFRAKVDALRDSMITMSGAMKTMLGEGGPIAGLIDLIKKKGSGISKEDVEGIKTLATVIKEVVAAVKFFTDTFTTKAAQGQPPNMTVITGLTDSLDTIRKALFDEKTGFMTGVIQDLLDPKKFPIDVSKADGIKKKVELIGVLLGPVKILSEIFKDLGLGTPPDGKKPQSFFVAIETALFGEDGNSNKLSDLLTKLKDALAGLDTKDVNKIAKLKPFFEILSSLTTSIISLGKEKIDFAPVDWNLRNFATLITRGYLHYFVASLSADSIFLKNIGTIEKFSKSISKIKTLLDNLQRITETKIASGEIIGIGAGIDYFADKIVSADGKLTGKLSNNTGLVNVVKGIGKLGKISVTHNIPGVQMVVNVSLDAKQLATQLAPQIIRVDLSKDTNKPQRLAVEPGGSERPDLR